MGEIGLLSGVIGACGRWRASSVASSVARRSSPAAWRGDVSSARNVESTMSFCARISGCAASRARWRRRSKLRGVQPSSGGSISIGSGVGSSSTMPIPIAAIPSTSAWCIFGSSATRSSGSPSITCSSHSGRVRSSRWDISRAT